MNICTMIGNICKDIEVRIIPGTNKKVIQNTIAVRRDFKNKEGNYDSDFINIVMFEPYANFVEKYVGKGDKVAVSGRWQTRSYESQNGTRYVNELVVGSIQLVSKPQSQQSNSYQKPQSNYQQTLTNDGYDVQGYTSQIEIETDDLPFY